MAARLSSEAGGGTVREGGVCQEREAIRMVGENAAQQEPYLKDVVPRLHIGYVDPLTVNVCIVGVIAAWTQALGKGVNTGRILKPLHIPLPPTPEAVWAFHLCASSLTWVYSGSSPC